MSANLFVTATGRPAVLAHRGMGQGTSTSGHRENTLDSLQRAVEEGADWVECDVQLSSDNDLVLTHNVVHDGRTIRATTTAELLDRGLDTLTDAHERLPRHVGFDLDVKISLADVPGRLPDLFADVVAWAEKAQSERPLLLVSFCPTLPARSGGVPLGWMTNPGSWYYESVVSAVRMGAAVAGVHARDVLDVPPGCPTAVEVGGFARDYGIAVKAWGVEPGDVSALVAGGVTGLCGDDVAGIAAAVADLPGLPAT